jgi:hypothetical protein
MLAAAASGPSFGLSGIKIIAPCARNKNLKPAATLLIRYGKGSINQWELIRFLGGIAEVHDCKII